MELQVNEQKQELKFHGTYGFPVNVGRKKLSAYERRAFPWHWHDEIELTLVLSGEIEYRVNDSCYLLREGEGLFCNSGAIHSGNAPRFADPARPENGPRSGELDGSNDCDYVSLTFHPRFLYGYEGSVICTKYVEGIVNSPALSSLRLTDRIPWQKEALDSLRRIYDLFVKKPELYELEVQRLLLGIWGGLYRNYGDEVEKAPVEDAEKLERLRTLLGFLHGHYAERITLEDAARQVNLCKSECCRFFKRQMGVSLFDYLLDYRIGHSLKLLKAGRSVSEAALESGFFNSAYFARVFRQRTGRSPRQYKKEAGEARGKQACRLPAEEGEDSR